MRKNVLKAMTALCFCGLVLLNINLAFAEDDFIVDPHANGGSCTSASCEFCGGNGTGGGGSSAECNLCVVKKKIAFINTTVFSCKSTPRTNKCSASAEGITLSCDDATVTGCTNMLD